MLLWFSFGQVMLPCPYSLLCHAAMVLLLLVMSSCHIFTLLMSCCYATTLWSCLLVLFKTYEGLWTSREWYFKYFLIFIWHIFISPGFYCNVWKILTAVWENWIPGSLWSVDSLQTCSLTCSNNGGRPTSHSRRTLSPSVEFEIRTSWPCARRWTLLWHMNTHTHFTTLTSK